jgi:Winged helix-turn helix
MEKDLIEMSQRERDVLKVMSGVLKGDRTQVEAARLLGKSVRQVRRIRDRLKHEGDKAVVHALRGRPSNHRIDEAVKRSALGLYRQKYLDFGPTLAAEKLAEDDELKVAVRTLREWLMADGLWQRKRERDVHRSRRERRACFGELLQADASTHDWLEGRGARMVLVGMIDDASSRVLARFHPAETTEAYMDVLGRWIRKHGRPLAWYSDRHGIFRAEDAQDKPVATQFSRALSELDVELICANSPQAKGRVERLWGTAQDRLVKELRLAKCTTLEGANGILEAKFLPWFNRRCLAKPASNNDTHRPMGKGHDLAAILSHQESRVVANDYTIRFENESYQLLPPAWPGERGGKVIVERRLDGSMKVRFKTRYLAYRKIEKRKEEDGRTMGALPPNPRSLAHEPNPAGGERKSPAAQATGPDAVHRTAGRSSRTPAELCPPGGGSCGRGKDAYRPTPNHPWR